MKQHETTTLEFERRIAAPPEIVWSYLTDPELYRLWQGVDAELDARPGGTYRVTMTGRTGTVVRGTYLEVEPPTRIVLTWGWEDRPEGLAAGARDVPVGASTIEMTLSPDGDDTVLHVRHAGLPTEDAVTFHTGGWNMSLERLTAVAQDEDPGPNPFDVA